MTSTWTHLTTIFMIWTHFDLLCSDQFPDDLQKCSKWKLGQRFLEEEMNEKVWWKNVPFSKTKILQWNPDNEWTNLSWLKLDLAILSIISIETDTVVSKHAAAYWRSKTKDLSQIEIQHLVEIHPIYTECSEWIKSYGNIVVKSWSKDYATTTLWCGQLMPHINMHIMHLLL